MFDTKRLIHNTYITVIRKKGPNIQGQICIQYIYNCIKKKGAKYRGRYVYNTYVYNCIKKKGAKY